MELLHKYGDTVSFVPHQRGAKLNTFEVTALVAQSHVNVVEDKSKDNGVREEEVLTLVYLDPTAGKTIMSGAELESAVKVVYGIKALGLGVTQGYHQLTVQPVVPVPLNPNPEKVQYSPEHRPQLSTATAVNQPGFHLVAASEWDSWTPEQKDEYLKLHPGTVVTDTSATLPTDSENPATEPEPANGYSAPVDAAPEVAEVPLPEHPAIENEPPPEVFADPAGKTIGFPHEDGSFINVRDNPFPPVNPQHDLTGHKLSDYQ